MAGIVKLRRSRRITGKDLARMVSVGNQYVSQIETGVRKPSGRLVERMAAALGVPAEDICVNVPDPMIDRIVEIYRTLPRHLQAAGYAEWERLIAEYRATAKAPVQARGAKGGGSVRGSGGSAQHR
jgi:transcriptional regulator with XRE-family HTH domain